MARSASTISSARRAREAIRHDFAPVMAIGVPSILANLATPVAALYVTRVWSDFGDAAVAGGAMVDRVIPLAFGVIFALTGSIGPIIGQNYGARLMDRVRRTMSDSFTLSVGYALVAWAVLAFAAPWIVAPFDARGDAAAFVMFFCRYGVAAWVFVTCLFVANTVFNNLGFRCWRCCSTGAGRRWARSPSSCSARAGAASKARSSARRRRGRVRPRRRRAAYRVRARLANAIKTK